MHVYWFHVDTKSLSKTESVVGAPRFNALEQLWIPFYVK